LGILRTLALLMALGASGPAAFGALSDDAKPVDPPEPAAPAPVSTEPPPADAGKPAPSPESATARQEPPAPPRKYLEVGANLFNKGRYELASRYLQAAQMYRDRLSNSERIVLDVYREKLDHYLRTTSAAPAQTPAPSAPADAPPNPGTTPPNSEAVLPAGRTDTGVTPASAYSPSTSPNPVDPVQALSRRPDASEASVFGPVPDPGPPPSLSGSDVAPPGAEPANAAILSTAPTIAPKVVPAPPVDAAAVPTGMRGSGSWRDTADTKQKGRWLLQLAREQIKKGHLDIAEQAVAEARSLDVQWTLFDETPDRLAEALAKARAKAGQPARARTGDLLPPQSRDRRSARARLKEARAALAANDLEKAESLSREVRSWGISLSLFDDTPDKVDAAIIEARRREALQSADLMVRTYYRDRSRTGQERAPAPAPAGTSRPQDVAAPSPSDPN
jgi:hypothetical protein